MPVLHLASPPPPSPSAASASAAARTPAQARAESVIASKPAGLLPDHLRNDLRTSGPKARGGRTPLAEPRHLRSEVGNVIFGIPSDASAAATAAGGLSSPRRATTAADSYASPAERRDHVFGEQPQSRPTRGARSHLSMSHKHTRSTADGVIFNRDTAAEIPSIDPVAVPRDDGVRPAGGARANPLPKCGTAYDYSPRRTIHEGHLELSNGNVIFGAPAVPSHAGALYSASGAAGHTSVGTAMGVPVGHGAGGAPLKGKGAYAPTAAAGGGGSGAVPSTPGGVVTFALDVSDTAPRATAPGGRESSSAAARAAAIAEAAAAAGSGGGASGEVGDAPPSFLDEILPRRRPHNKPASDPLGVSFNGEVLPAPRRSEAYAVRAVQAAAHMRDTVTAQVFNGGGAAAGGGGGGSEVTLRDHPSFRDAAGMPSDAEAAQSHPSLPGFNGTPRQIPGANAAAMLGREAEAIIATREGALASPRQSSSQQQQQQQQARADIAAAAADGLATPMGRVELRAPEQPPPSARATFPWEPEADVPSDRPAPPKEYASQMASASERARFRGVRRVEGATGSNHKESYPAAEGGVLSQALYAEAAPRRWDDQVFENRLKHALQASAARKKPPTPRSAARSFK